MPDVVHQPHLHINAVGSDFPGKTELPLSMLRRAMVVPDDTEQCLREGESQRLGADEVGPDLAQLVKAAGAFESARGRLTVFDSTGWSLEDLVAAELMIDHANRLGVGLRTNLQSLPDDPYSPYGALLSVNERD
jgi:ornithine cyclodeaminase/alanine dehydrogenase-like protein (mu-crystallin family)